MKWLKISLFLKRGKHRERKLKCPRRAYVRTYIMYLRQSTYKLVLQGALLMYRCSATHLCKDGICTKVWGTLGISLIARD